MKKILFAINNLSLGGIQKALINLLDELSRREDLEIYLLLTRDTGELRRYVPENVRMIKANRMWSLIDMTNAESREKGLISWLVRAFFAVIIKSGRKDIAMKIISVFQKNLGSFDVAVAFRHPDLHRNILGGSNEIILNCCKASLKATFIHCDYKKYGGECEYNNNLIRRFDRIGVVSENCKEVLLEVMPELKDKAFKVTNCQNYDEIKRLSEEETVYYSHSRPVFVTVCRLGAEKGIVRMLEVLKILKYEGFEFEWHIAGDGEEMGNITETIKKMGFQQNVILEGATDNPYRYMADADFFLLPSYHEATPMVICEALALKIPVVSTKTSSSDEMLNDSIAIVAENSSEGILNCMREIFDDYSIIAKLQKNLENITYDNKTAVAEFMKLIN